MDILHEDYFAIGIGYQDGFAWERTLPKAYWHWDCENRLNYHGAYASGFMAKCGILRKRFWRKVAV